MTPLEVELLSRQGNYVVLRLPGRSFPGIHHDHAQDLAEELEGILGA